MAKCEPPRNPDPPHRHRHDYPSFSSSLLDAIYRSIDSDSDPKTPTLPHRQTQFPHSDDRRHRRFFSETISSNYARPRPVLTRSDRIRTGITPIQEKKVPDGGSIRSRIRRSSIPGSPGSRLSAFLNMLFAAAGGGIPRKPKPVSSYSRSGKREPVRLSPVSVGLSDKVLRPVSRCSGRDFEKMVEEEEEDRESVSSSELFELESLAVIGEFADELPVYGTTNLGKTGTFSLTFLL